MKTILVADDIQINVDILVELLADEYNVLTANNGKKALEVIHTNDVDLVLLDIIMPEMDGYETCRILKSNKSTKEIPVIFITARHDEESIEQAYKVGGIDYVTKPFRIKELLARVNREIQLKSLIEHLHFVSSYDEMTKIYNRRKFFELAEKQFEKKDNLYALMIDIDKFKDINDTYGHSCGDKVIKNIAKTLNDNLPKDATFGRIGGEEFALIYYQNSQEKVITETEKLRILIEKLKIKINHNTTLKCSISIGVSKADNNTLTLDSLLKKADNALYDAKGSGRNKVIFR